MVPPCSDRISRVPPYSKIVRIFTYTGLSPTLAWLSIHFYLLKTYHWADPRSLATTSGISVDFFSSGYWDVSLLRVCFNAPMYSVHDTQLRVGFPIRKSPGQRVLTSYRGLSQPATSFIAFNRQGIHQMPFKTLEFISRAGVTPLQSRSKNLELGPTTLYEWFIVLGEIELLKLSQFC